jgi:hypothetical protein
LLFFPYINIRIIYGNTKHIWYDLFDQDFNPYKQSKYSETNNGDISTSVKDLEKDKYQCWVIEVIKNAFGAFELEYLKLAKLDITILAEYNYSSSKKEISDSEVVKTYTSHFVFSVFYANIKSLNYPTKTLTKNLVKDLRSTIEIVSKFKNTYCNKFKTIDKAFEDFLNLNEIPTVSPFRVLGYFAILEILLIKNGGDSITNQLKNKISLINNRMESEICIGDYFSDTPKLSTIIAKLYNLRSQIAHGSFVDFKEFHIKPKGEPSISIPEFIYSEILKKVLIHAMKEPQLIDDLRNC